MDNHSLNQDRIDRFIQLLTDEQWDLLLVYGQAWRKDFFRCLLNVNFTGPHAAAAMDRSGQVRVLASHPWDFEAMGDFEAIGVHEAMAESRAGSALFEYDFADGLRKLVSGRAGASVAIAGMELMEARFVDAIRSVTGRVPVSATGAVEEIRRHKNAHEIECMKKAAELSDRGYQHFAEVIEAGMREYELVAEVEAFLKSNGAEDNFMLIASGGTEVTGMKPPTDRKFQWGDSVTTELTPQVNGYWAQICRTLVLGDPNPDQRKAFSIFAESQKAAEDLLKPGVNVSDLARVQNDVFRKYGYGDYTGSKYTRVRGHGLGLHFDENPYVLEDVSYVMKDGMTLIAHPNTYLPLSGYMVFGDSLMVTASGCLALNTTERKLFQKGGGR